MCVINQYGVSRKVNRREMEEREKSEHISFYLYVFRGKAFARRDFYRKLRFKKAKEK